MAQDHDFHVAIIGAGSTGLLLAQGLKQHGIKATVFEREDSDSYQKRPREWGMTLHWGADAISKCIPPELEAGLNEGIACDPFYVEVGQPLPHYNGKTGEKLFETPGQSPKRVSRKKLRNYLSQGLDVQYGKRLSSIESGPNKSVVATFTDGTTATATLLIGCDGANSAVRPFLVGKEVAQVEDLHVSIFNVSCTFPQDIAKLQRTGHPMYRVGYHPEQNSCWWQSIQEVKDPEKPETWVFQNMYSWSGAPDPADLPDSASRLKFWKTQAKGHAEPWKSTGAALPDDLHLRLDHLTIWKPTMDWSGSEFAGRVTIAGDAAHAMPPYRAQGLNYALEDAATLVEELTSVRVGQKTLAEAMSTYEQEMKERSLKEIQLSTMQARAAHNWEALMSAPMVKMGMHKYREGLAAEGKEVETAGS